MRWAGLLLVGCGSPPIYDVSLVDATELSVPACELPVPATDVSHPDAVVGDGHPESCTESAVRDAVTVGGVITFDCGDNLTIAIRSELVVTRNTTLDGNGKIVFGGVSSRFLHVTAAASLVVQNLTFRDGDSTTSRDGGGAILQDGGSLIVIGCDFEFNRAGASSLGGAISGAGPGMVVVETSRFANNSSGAGGAIGLRGEPLTIVNSVFTNNIVSDGQATDVSEGGAVSFVGAPGAPLGLCGDTLDSNHAAAAGGAIFADGVDGEQISIDRSTFAGNSVDMGRGTGGGVHLIDARTVVSASTISGNVASSGAGIWIGPGGPMELTNLTIVNNTGAPSGGVHLEVPGRLLNLTIGGNSGVGLDGATAGVQLQNTILADNSGGNCAAAYSNGGGNIETPSAGTACSAGEVVADPLLGPLAINGGPTYTMLLAARSPAVGIGSMCPATDQRGLPRSSVCSAGAVESR